MYQPIYMLILNGLSHMIGPPIPPDTGFIISDTGDYISDDTNTPILYAE